MEEYVVWLVWLESSLRAPSRMACNRPRWACPNGALTEELQQKPDRIRPGLSGRDDRLGGS